MTRDQGPEPEAPRGGHRFRFERLNVWQEARRYNRAVYAITRGFPADERFGMTSQLRRAALSISSNIAEGSGRNSDKDFAHFLEQAYGSLMETASQLYIAFDENYLTAEQLDNLLNSASSLAGQLVSFNRALVANPSKVNPREAR